MTAPTAARDRMTAVVREVVDRILPGVVWDGTTGRKHLRELGADSVDRVEIILGLIERLGLERDMAAFGELPDVDALVDHLLAAEGSR
ncbi:acyl carrier protein [Kitasatospora sp. NPDC056327]|uniref:acyl carrier protein n=1 Tax=Kitasatospora sp. NPDC056327 TaxID=3345785 RepID=UPI0035DFF133